MASPLISVVIPAFNEESRIVGTLEQVLEYLSSQEYAWEIVVADDGSTDGTATQVQSVMETHPEARGLRLLSLPHGGKGWAVKQGMLQAVGEYRFMCDADLSMPIAQLARFLPPERGDYDVAIASREVAGARRIGEPEGRKLMGRVFRLMVRLLAAPGLADTQCGFKCFRAEAAIELLGRQRLQGFAFDVELLFLARKLGLRVIEVPIDWYYRPQSKVRPVRDSLAMVRDILRVRWHYLRGHYTRTSIGTGQLVS